MNLHLSEVVSDLVEPLVDRFVGGRESISTEDMIAKFVDMNETNRGWSRWSWYEGLKYEEYIGCGTCEGEWTRVLKMDEPELCVCDRGMTPGYVRVTAKWMRYFRRKKWEDRVG